MADRIAPVLRFTSPRLTSAHQDYASAALDFS
jgi:hypothetical protein